MRSWLPAILIAMGAAAFLVWGSLAGPKNPPKLGKARATRLAAGFVAFVPDGDTLRLADNRRVRLLQIDAPEFPQGECYSEQAMQALERLAPIGTEVTPHLDPELDARDENGRYLAYVTKEHVNINLQLVELGAAAPYFYRGRRGRYAGALMAGAQRAKAAGRGLWGACPGTRLNPNRRVDTGR